MTSVIAISAQWQATMRPPPNGRNFGITVARLRPCRQEIALHAPASARPVRLLDATPLQFNAWLLRTYQEGAHYIS